MVEYTSPDKLAHEWHLNDLKTCEKINISTIFPLKTGTFEGETFKIPNNYDKYLNILYGDYNIFPSSVRDDAEMERRRKITD